jgi:serine/threonine-protein kinase
LSLTIGTRLGVYEVTAQVGEGGMGQVYRARDTKLNRDVALKILPDAFANDPDRLARFTREAQTLASLNHPNIAHIHGLEEGRAGQAGQAGQAEHAAFIVMELVEGEDLSQRIARGAIPIDEALPIAKQIAEALEAAHEQGIIHRDLKPANIKVRADGTVKVLDFGLAKAMEGAGRAGEADRAGGNNLTQSPTITTPAMTAAGMILGTAAYMSPEQARGKPVDKRADIWAFGVVVYEMLTGRRAFAGDDISITLAAVMMKEPEWGALPAPTPWELRRLLTRCLKKDPKARMRDIGDARLQIV